MRVFSLCDTLKMTFSSFMHDVLTFAQDSFQKALEFLGKEFASLQTGRANASLVDSIEVDVYGSRTPIKHLANISLPSAQEIFIDPWDKSQLTAIEKAIRDCPDLGLNPTNTGAALRINVPALTEERRKEIVKIAHEKTEHARVSIRKARHEALEILKKEEKAGEMGEDDLHREEKELQKMVDEANKKVDELMQHKEKELMTV